MRKYALPVTLALALSAVAMPGAAQRRGRRPPAAAAPAAPTEPPESPAIANELRGIAWGATHEQVITYWREQIRQRYLPQMRGLGLIEQDRLLAQRDAEVTAIQNSYVVFNGALNQRRWDSSFVGDEYLHNNNESMLVREDPTNGTREFYFFFQDRLWKRFQARRVPQGMNFEAFAASLDGIFGNGLRLPRSANAGDVFLVWQDATTRLRVFDQSTFHSVFCLVYEQRELAAHMSSLREQIRAREEAARQTQRVEPTGPQVEDRNEDVVDRITGQTRRTQTAPSAAPSAGPSAAPRDSGAAADAAAPPPGYDGLRGI